MKKKAEINDTRERHYEKLRFISDYEKVERKYNKYRKLRKASKIIFVLAYLGIGATAIFNYSLSLILSTYFSMAFAPTYYVFCSVMKDTINDCSTTSITYQQFKQMYKSGEVEELKKELEELRHPKPVQKGLNELKLQTATATSQTPNRTTTINKDISKDR